MVTDDILAYSRLRFPPSAEERRRIVVRDAFSWALVVAIHILFFMTLVISLEQSRDRLGRRGAVETILNLALLHRADAPIVTLIKPDTHLDEDKDTSAKPLTYIPPVPVIPKIEAAPKAGDVLNSVGEFLACGASNFEYLNSAQQARCPRQPWQGLQLPNGTIVLNPLPRAIIQTQNEQQFSGAEALSRQMRTAPACPMLVNTPCLSDMFSGNNSAAPGVPAPH